MNTEEVYKELQEEFMQQASGKGLFGLTSQDSGKSFESLFGRTTVIAILLYAVAYVIALKDRMLDLWQQEVEKTALKTRYGTWSWWIEAAKNFQYGDTTEVIDGTVGYRTTDQTKRIVTAATVVQTGRTLTIKAAKGISGSLQKLTEEEKSAFDGYIQNIKPLGVNVMVMSTDADRVVVEGEVTYNSEAGSETMKNRVIEALNEYFASLQFGGTIFLSQVVDAIMDVEGVIDVEISSLKVSDTEVRRQYIPISGYAQVVNSDGLVMVANYDTGR